MSRFKPPDVEENVGCNLIPMIDIMFLLLLFFMLGADMSQREFEDVNLPQADMIQEDDNVKGASGHATISVYHRLPSPTFNCPLAKNAQTCRDELHWLVVIRGREYTLETIKEQLAAEAARDREEPTAPGKKQMSKVTISIRADQLAPYGIVQRLIETCGIAGLYKIEVGAARPTKA